MNGADAGAERRAERPLLGWDVAAATLVALMAGFGAAEVWSGDPPPGGLGSALGILALLLALYAALGRDALRRATLDLPARPAATVFLVALIAVVGAATALVPSYASLQALAYPAIWTLATRYASAVRWSAALALAVGAGFSVAFVGDDWWAGVVAAAGIAGLSLAFAVVMGTWITRIFQRGERHRLLAEQLRRAQAEVAALSEAAGAAAERERLSRELHDTLTQTLAGLVMLAEQAARALDAGDTSRARDRVDRVGSAAREAVAEARALVATTQPLGDGGLEAAIERVAARLRADTGLDVTCALDAAPLDRERQVVLLRAVQEGLANARRHARASRVAVELRASGDGEVRLRVEDDGTGPDPARVRAGGFGLTGLADRVRGAGGAFRFGPGERGGAVLEVRLPSGGAGGGGT